MPKYSHSFDVLLEKYIKQAIIGNPFTQITNISANWQTLQEMSVGDKVSFETDDTWMPNTAEYSASILLCSDKAMFVPRYRINQVPGDLEHIGWAITFLVSGHLLMSLNQLLPRESRVSFTQTR